jgi:hypothetical protein
MAGDATRDERLHSAANHPANRTAAKVMEQKSGQLGGFAGHIPAFPEVPNALPFLVPCGPGEHVVVGPLPFRHFLEILEAFGIQYDLAGLRILGGALVQVKASFGEVYLAAQKILEFLFSKTVTERE